MKLQKIDALYLTQHHRLIEEDECFYMLSYTPHESFDLNEHNSIICNLKKTMDRKGRTEWKYKQQAIKQCAKFLQEVDITKVFTENITIVPIPPSKCKSDPKYDDRLIRVLQEAFHDDLDIRELITQQESTNADHLQENRRSPAEIKKNYVFNKELAEGAKEIIIIFDDVLTTGAHFVAAKEFIKENMPHINSVKGLFIARRICANAYT